MSIYLLSVLSGLLSFILGLIVFLQGKKNSATISFSIFSIFSALWSVCLYLYINPVILTSYFWIKLVYFLVFIMVGSSFYFSFEFPYKNTEKMKLYFGIYIALSIIFSYFLFFTNLWVDNVSINELGFPQTSTGLVYPIWGIMNLFVGVWMFYNFGVKLRKGKGTMKMQVKNVFVGLSIMAVGTLITDVLVPVVYGNSNLFGLSPIFLLPFIGFSSYAILKHELLDVKVLTTQVLIFMILIILFTRVLMSQNINELAIDIVIFVLVLFIGTRLIISTTNEFKQRKRLADLNKSLKDLDKQKDEFLSMAAHELRAPMTAIKGYVTMVMEGDTGEISEKARGFLADANAINERLIRLVNNMLNVSRIEQGRMVYQDEVENLSNPVRAVFSQFAPEAERKGLKYTLKIPKKIKDKVKIDPDRIQEVIGNLLSNAVKYTDEGFVKVSLTQPKIKHVRFEVTDSGPGISVNEQERLFQKFQRVESNVGKTTGTGLGLYISKLLVEKFNGEIGLESKSGEGSTFWFELPLVD